MRERYCLIVAVGWHMTLSADDIGQNSPVVLARPLRDLSSPQLNSTSGFTLLEILVALGVLSTMISIATSFFMFNLRNNMNTQIQYEAMQAAQGVLDELRFEDISTLTGSPTERVTIGSRTYSVAVSYCQISSFCLSDEIKHIAAKVTYKDQLVYETDTVFSKF